MWHLLNYIPPRGKSRSSLPALIASFDVELFAPTFVSLTQPEGNKVKRAERPLLYHYIFLRGSENEIKRLCHTFEGFSFVLDRHTRRHVTLSDEAVEQFRIIARFYSGKLPCFPLEEINLEEGDRVQIVTGPCAGLTGTYISRKGGRSGNILVAVDSTMAAIVYDIPAEYVRVLEFAHDSRRVYDQLDSYATKLLAVIAPDDGPSRDAAEGVAAATVFVRRLGEVRISNPKLNAKLHILLYGAYCILGDRANALSAYDKYVSLASHVTNPKTIALCKTILDHFPVTTLRS